MDLERAIEIAAAAHRGQTDKAGKPYILHPLRVMLACEGETTQIVAVLHDVIEDTDWTPDALRAEGASDEILAALDTVTRREDETYSEFIERAARNEIGRAVKIADLHDNLDLSRIAQPTQADFARMDRYRAALRHLGGQLPELADGLSDRLCRQLAHRLRCASAMRSRPSGVFGPVLRPP